jgi:nonribosomal peptide synthetase DhbF
MQKYMRCTVEFGDCFFTMALFKAGPEKFFWYYRAHHIALDGFSASVFAVRQARVYTLLLAGRSSADGELEPLSVLLASDAQYLNSPEFQDDRNFWLNGLSGVPRAASISGRQARRIPRLPTQNVLDLSPEDATRLSVAARRVQTSLSGLLMAATAVYLHRWTGEGDVVLGLAVLGRSGRRQRAIPGMTANVLPIRLRISHETSLDDLARQVSRTVGHALEHQRYRFEDMRRDLRLPDNDSLFSVVINIMAFDYLTFGDCSVTPHNVISTPVSDVRIAVYGNAGADGMQVAVEVNPDLYDKASEHDICGRFRRILDWAELAEPTGA